MDTNASAIVIGDGDGGTLTRLIVTGEGHEKTAEEWAAKYNELLRDEQHQDGLPESWYAAESAVVRGEFVATQSTMPPVKR